MSQTPSGPQSPYGQQPPYGQGSPPPQQQQPWAQQPQQSQAQQQPQPSAYGQQPAGQQQTSRQESPWWAADAQQDPWRDPRSPANWSAPTQQLPHDQWSPGGQAPSPTKRDQPRRGLGVVIAVALAAGLLSGGAAGVVGYRIVERTTGPAPSSPSSSTLGAPASANRAPTSVAGIAAAVLPSVVQIQVTTSSGKGTGSGFVIDKAGYILTNNHVVSGATDPGKIQVAFQDGSRTGATVTGHDPYSDVAVIKVTGKDLKPLTLGDSQSVAVGDPVVAVGSPLGLAGTVTSGIVSALDRPVQSGSSENNGSEASQTFLSAVQTDAAINPGNSGGPLLDGSARVIGINSAIATLSDTGSKSGSIGLGFAIPIDQAKRVADQLIKTGKATRTIIGASVDDQYDGPVPGARLATVESSGPADKAGLKDGDVITKFGRRPVEDPVSLIADIRAEAPRTQITVEYVRDGKNATATVTLGEA